MPACWCLVNVIGTTGKSLVKRVILAPPVAGSRLVVCGEPGIGTSRAAWEAVAGVLAGGPGIPADRSRAGHPAVSSGTLSPLPG